MMKKEKKKKRERKRKREREREKEAINSIENGKGEKDERRCY